MSDEKMIRECAEVRGDVFTNWEAELIDSLWKHHIDQKKDLSHAQHEKLKQVYKKTCESDQ